MADTYTPPNPAVEWYNEWSGRTPLVTRYTLQILCGLYVISWFSSGISLALANIPYYTFLKFEVYRLVTAPLFCNSILSLIFVCMSFSPLGARMEQSMGSAKFLVLVAVVGVVSNLLFAAFCFLMAMLGTYEALLFQCQGFWVVLLALIALDCVDSRHDQPTRQLFMLPVNIPTMYYPLALLALFSLFAGPDLGMVIGCAFGYAYAYGWTPAFLKPSGSAVSAWERGCLSNLAMKPGYVALGAAMGPGGASGGGEWGSSSGGGGGGSGLGLGGWGRGGGGAQAAADPETGGGGGGWAANKVVDRNRPPLPSAPPAEGGKGDNAATGGFPGGGQTLSSTSASSPSWKFGGGGDVDGQQKSVDPAVARAARLAALERKQQHPAATNPVPSAPPLLPPPPSHSS